MVSKEMCHVAVGESRAEVAQVSSTAAAATHAPGWPQGLSPLFIVFFE